MSHGSKKVIYAAAAANFAIAVSKFFGAWLTGSSAMFSEGIHSMIDTGNQGLLLIGMKKASKPADKKHPFGYGKEMYFWSFVVAILIFAGGSGMALYEGITHIIHPAVLNYNSFNLLGISIGFQYIVLVILFAGMLFEGKSWLIAYQEFRSENPNKFWKGIVDAKNPTVVVILIEDTAAMAGLIVAFVGVGLAYYFNNPLLDALATVGIGIILAIVSAFLAVECKSLLIGEAASDEVVDGITEIASEIPGVNYINEIVTNHVGPDDVIVCMSLDFADHVTSNQIEAVVSQVEKEIKGKFEQVSRVYIEAQNYRSHRRDAELEAEELLDRES